MQHEFCGQFGLFVHIIDSEASQYGLRKSNANIGIFL